MQFRGPIVLLMEMSLRIFVICIFLCKEICSWLPSAWNLWRNHCRIRFACHVICGQVSSLRCKPLLIQDEVFLLIGPNLHNSEPGFCLEAMKLQCYCGVRTLLNCSLWLRICSRMQRRVMLPRSSGKLRQAKTLCRTYGCWGTKILIPHRSLTNKTKFAGLSLFWTFRYRRKNRGNIYDV